MKIVMMTTKQQHWLGGVKRIRLLSAIFCTHKTKYFSNWIGKYLGFNTKAHAEFLGFLQDGNELPVTWTCAFLLSETALQHPISSNKTKEYALNSSSLLVSAVCKVRFTGKYWSFYVYWVEI